MLYRISPSESGTDLLIIPPDVGRQHEHVMTGAMGGLDSDILPCSDGQAFASMGPDRIVFSRAPG